MSIRNHKSNREDPFSAMSKTKKIDLDQKQENLDDEFLKSEVPFSKMGMFWSRIYSMVFGLVVVTIVAYFCAAFLYSGWSDGVTGYEVLARENATHIFWFGQLVMCFLLFKLHHMQPKSLSLVNGHLRWSKSELSRFEFDPATMVYTRYRFADQNVVVRLNQGENSLYDFDVFNNQIKPIVQQGRRVKWWEFWVYQLRNNTITFMVNLLGYSSMLLIYIIVYVGT